MLKPARMKRVNLLVLEKDEPRVTRALGRSRLMHLEPVRPAPDMPVHEKPGLEKDRESSRQVLVAIDRVMAMLGVEPEGPEAELPYSPPEAIAAEVRQIQTEIEELADQLNRYEADRQQLRGMIEDLEAFVGLGVPVDRLGDFSFLHFAVGTVPTAELAQLRRGVGENVVLLPRGHRGKLEQVVAVTSKKGRFALETELETAGFKPETVSEKYEGLADELEARAADQLSRIEVQAELAERLRGERAQKHGPTLRHWRRTIVNEMRITDASANFAYTDSACYISGWVPADSVNRATETVLEATGGRAVIEVFDPEPGSEPPSKFDHHPLLRPFADLVAGYGFPRYREIEPTLIVTVTFLAMFGFMFGDVGHGAVLLVVGLALKLRSKKQKTRDIGVIITACGLAAVAMGAVYGSYFGQAWLPSLWQEPIGGHSDPLATLMVAVLGGAALMSLGLVFNIVNRLRSGDVLHGVFDRFGLVGALVYWAALWLAIHALVFGSEDMPVVPVAVVIAVCVAVLFIREPLLVFLKRHKGEEAESLPEAIITAGVEVMEVFISYLANSLSFLRLAAYAMGHAALLIATLEMTKAMDQLGPMGKPLAVLVFVVGNLIIIVLEGLVAAIQAVRLEYYEFFGKFFAGTGRAYRPFETE